MTEQPSGFLAFWKRWRGPMDGRLANANEGREEARIQWGKLSEPHKTLAHEWGPHFQKEFKRANGDDCAMLHCCRYLSKKRFLNYEDDELPSSAGIVIKKGEPGWNEWLAHDPTIKTFGGVIVVPTPLPGDDQ